ncbi:MULTISPECIES: hypothetical protein [unclassified Streptomyces]|uniref:hypothetical protein n=1 Tax=unclassified Streptomyces TaxID=2593676 RepID=UPI000DC7ED2B|nr:MULTISPECIES: hypothetical protein [unclassified Streptomyces]AWZ08470.1 hypothetical protein DRB89_32155 [Streptomyces sp. ICC4]AWZ16246.1 hypothetical protein DRB96_32925 [Streptomyces sp. ICC1]
MAVAAPHAYCVEITNQDVNLSRPIVAAIPRDHAGPTLRAIAGGRANGKGVSVTTYAHTGRRAGHRLPTSHLAVL